MAEIPQKPSRVRKGILTLERKPRLTQSQPTSSQSSLDQTTPTPQHEGLSHEPPFDRDLSLARDHNSLGQSTTNVTRAVRDSSPKGQGGQSELDSGRNTREEVQVQQAEVPKRTPGLLIFQRTPVEPPRAWTGANPLLKIRQSPAEPMRPAAPVTIERLEAKKTADVTVKPKKVAEPWVFVDPKREKKAKPKSTTSTTKVSIKLADIESAAKRMAVPQKQAAVKKEMEVPVAEKHPRRMIDLFNFDTLATLEKKKLPTADDLPSTRNVSESKSMISQHIDSVAWPEVSMATLLPSEKVKKPKSVPTKKISSSAKVKEETKKAPEKKLRRAGAKTTDQVNPNLCDVNATFVKKGKERSKKVRLTKLKKLIVSERNTRWIMDAILKPIIDKVVNSFEEQQAPVHKPKKKHKQILASLEDFSRTYHTLPEGVLARKYCRQMSQIGRAHV